MVIAAGLFLDERLLLVPLPVLLPPPTLPPEPMLPIRPSPRAAWESTEGLAPPERFDGTGGGGIGGSAALGDFAWKGSGLFPSEPSCEEVVLCPPPGDRCTEASNAGILAVTSDVS